MSNIYSSTCIMTTLTQIIKLYNVDRVSMTQKKKKRKKEEFIFSYDDWDLGHNGELLYSTFAYLDTYI